MDTAGTSTGPVAGRLGVLGSPCFLCLRGLVLGDVGGVLSVGGADPQGVGPGQSGSIRERGGPPNVGSTKRAAQTVSLAAEGKSVQTYPPSRTVIGEECERIAPNHQADGQFESEGRGPAYDRRRPHSVAPGSESVKHRANAIGAGGDPGSARSARSGRASPTDPRSRAGRQGCRRECRRILIRLTSAEASPGGRRRLPSHPGRRTRSCNG